MIKRLLMILAWLSLLVPTVTALAQGEGEHRAGLMQYYTDVARLRVMHASPDAPEVDIVVDGAVMATNLSMGDISEYVSLPGGAHHVRLVPAGTNGPALLATDVSLTIDGAYTLVAANKLADIAPLVFEDDKSWPRAGRAHVRLIHASPDAPALDVGVVDGPTWFYGVTFGENGGYASIDVGTYDLEVRLAGTDTVLKTIRGVTLQAGATYTLFPVGLTSGAPAFDMVQSTDAGVGSMRVAHMASGAPSVDVLVDGKRFLIDVPYTRVTEYNYFPIGAHLIEVVPAGASGPVVLTVTMNINLGEEYTLTVADAWPNVTPYSFVDDNQLPAPGHARLRVLHTAPSAGAVDVALRYGPELASNLLPGQTGGYVTVAVGSWTLEVRQAGTDNVLLTIPGMAFRENTVYTLSLAGLVGGEPSLDAVLRADKGLARLRLINASPDAPPLDVTLGGILYYENLTYPQIGEYQTFPSGRYWVEVMPAGQLTPIVLSSTLRLDPNMQATILLGHRYEQLAVGKMIENNSAPPLGQARVKVVHSAPGGPHVDVALIGPQEMQFEDVAFGEWTDAIEVTAGDFILEVQRAGTDRAILRLPDVTLQSGAVYTVYLMGMDNSGSPLIATVQQDVQYSHLVFPITTYVSAIF